MYFTVPLHKCYTHPLKWSTVKEKMVGITLRKNQVMPFSPFKKHIKHLLTFFSEFLKEPLSVVNYFSCHDAVVNIKFGLI